MKKVTRAYPAKVEAEDAGEFTALVSAFGVVDAYNEVIEPGAFTESLAAFGTAPIPILWNHRWDDLTAHLGAASGVETGEGLEIRGRLDLDDPAAAKAWRLLKEGRVREFSIGGYESEGDIRGEEVDGRFIWRVDKFDLVEVSIVLRGANPATELRETRAAPDPSAPGGEPAPRHRAAAALSLITSAAAAAERSPA